MKRLFLTFILLVGSVVYAAGFFASEPVAVVLHNNAASGTVLSYQYGNVAAFGTVWTTLVSALPAPVTAVTVVNSSTSGTMLLGIGPAGFEGTVLFIPTGANINVPLQLGSGARLAIMGAYSTPITAGDISFSFTGDLKH